MRAEPETLRCLVEDSDIVADRPALAVNAKPPIRCCSRTTGRERIWYRGHEFRIPILEVESGTDRDAVRQFVRDGRIDVHRKKLHFDRIVAAEPVLVIFGGQTKRRVEAKAEEEAIVYSLGDVGA